MKPWERIAYSESHKIGWRHLMIKKFRMPDGQILDYGIYDEEKQKFAATIALTTENKVVIARQFRPGPELVMDELPGGGVEKDEDPEQAAIRELAEETGYTPKRVEFLGIARKEAYRNGIHYYYIAYDCVKDKEPELDKDEYVEAHEITIEELINNAKTAMLTDSVAVLLALEKLQKISS